LATLRFTPAALRDLERLSAFLRDTDPEGAAMTIPLILKGLKLLAAHPLIGRPIDGHRRELLIFRGRAGYVAQYAFRPFPDEVVFLAIRHQREVDS